MLACFHLLDQKTKFWLSTNFIIYERKSNTKQHQKTQVHFKIQILQIPQNWSFHSCFLKKLIHLVLLAHGRSLPQGLSGKKTPFTLIHLDKPTYLFLTLAKNAFMAQSIIGNLLPQSPLAALQFFWTGVLMQYRNFIWSQSLVLLWATILQLISKDCDTVTADTYEQWVEYTLVGLC